MTERLLDVENLTVEFKSGGSTMKAVNGVNLQLNKKETLGIVGESGSRKKCDSHCSHAFNSISARKNNEWKNSI